jgi:hypothetical protein
VNSKSKSKGKTLGLCAGLTSLVDWFSIGGFSFFPLWILMSHDPGEEEPGSKEQGRKALRGALVSPRWSIFSSILVEPVLVCCGDSAL